jgi:hypothetical protein
VHSLDAEARGDIFPISKEKSSLVLPNLSLAFFDNLVPYESGICRSGWIMVVIHCDNRRGHHHRQRHVSISTYRRGRFYVGFVGGGVVVVGEMW